ncbi:MAG: biotin--[acetyl-CoA-carboxylase] ligase [Pseudomonadota bacterium]
MTAAPAGGQSSTIALPPGWALHRYDVVGSTNDVAKELAEKGAPHGTVVMADRQAAGRGRHGRAWSSPAGNLYASVVLRPEMPAAVVAQLSLIASLAMAEALAELALEIDVRVKWPNDVLIGNAKISGLLLESAGPLGDKVDWVVIGSGVNIAHRPDLDRPTISLAETAAVPVTPLNVLEAYCGQLEMLVGVWRSGEFAAIRPRWLQRAIGVGSPVSVKLGDSAVNGRFAGLDEGGAIIVQAPDGARRSIAAGELVLQG